MEDNREMREAYDQLKTLPSYLAGDDNTLYHFDHILNIQKQDIDRGYITRYFVRRSNVDNGEIVEIDKDKYNVVKNSKLHQTIEVIWRISGALDSMKNEQWTEDINLYTGVLDANEAAIKRAELEMPGIKYKLNDLLQYYQLSAR